MTKKKQLERVFRNLLNSLLVEHDLFYQNDSSKLLDDFTELLIKEVTIRTNIK